MIRRAGPNGLWVAAVVVAALLLLGLLGQVEAFRPSVGAAPRPLQQHPSTTNQAAAAAGTYRTAPRMAGRLGMGSAERP